VEDDALHLGAPKARRLAGGQAAVAARSPGPPAPGTHCDTLRRQGRGWPHVTQQRRAQVWYGIPANASEALEAAMRDALPHLFEHTPDLLYQLVTLVSPLELQARALPRSKPVRSARCARLAMLVSPRELQARSGGCCSAALTRTAVPACTCVSQRTQFAEHSTRSSCGKAHAGLPASADTPPLWALCRPEA